MFIGLISKYVPERWKNSLMLSRWGNSEVRSMYSLNMFVQAAFTVGLILFWLIMRSWFFKEFNPFSYFVVNKDFFQSITVGLPLLLYAFLNGQMDWFGSSDAHEKGTLMDERLSFKWFVSAGAGLFEELFHRGALIYVGLIMVFLSNTFIQWILPVVFVLFCLNFLSTMKPGFFMGVIGILAAILGAKYLYDVIPENLVLIFNGYVLVFLKWITSSYNILAPFIIVLFALALGITIYVIKLKKHYQISPLEFIFKLSLCSGFGIYAMPLGVKAIESMPIIPTNAGPWTTLLYLGAVLWSNAKFRNGHKYQGPYGMMNSYIFGLYMFYITFGYGLLYAIILHALYDGIIFTSEHICHVIKNR